MRAVPGVRHSLAALLGAVLALVFLSVGFVVGGLTVGAVTYRQDQRTERVVLYCRDDPPASRSRPRAIAVRVPGGAGTGTRPAGLGGGQP